MKRLMSTDPDTLEKTQVCTFELVGDRVVITPESERERSYIAGLGTPDGLLTPADGKRYYDLLERCLRGTYFYVEKVPEGQSARPGATG
jgi:hypothetical protein